MSGANTAKPEVYAELYNRSGMQYVDKVQIKWLNQQGLYLLQTRSTRHVPSILNLFHLSSKLREDGRH